MKRHTFVHRGKLEHNPRLAPDATHFVTDKGVRRRIRRPKLDGIIFGFQDTPNGIALTQVDEVRLPKPVLIRPAHYRGLKGLGPGGGDIGDDAARLMLGDAIRASANRTIRARLRRKASSIAQDGELVSPSADVIGDGTDVAKPRKQYIAKVRRVVRDTAMVRRLKRRHRDCCQLCGTTVRLIDGSTYSEGHHLQPLNARHNGPDVASNILVLCPNCHAICDMAGRLLEASQIRGSQHHTCGSEFLQYHNNLVRKRHGAAS